jgi:hypothetical protein
MTSDRTRELLGAYGADPARWPRDEIPGAAGPSDSGDLDEARFAARRIDGLLSLYTVEPASAALKATVLAVPDRAVDIRDVAKAGRSQAARPSWSLSGAFLGAVRRALPQLTGLAIASALGFMVGVADLLPAHDHSVSVDASGLVLGEDALGGFDS